MIPDRLLKPTRFVPGVLATLLLFPGCHGNYSPTEPGDSPRTLPPSFQMIGTATSIESDGTSVTCSLELFLELPESPRRLPGILEYEGTHGGSLQRTGVDAEGNGLALWPDVFGDVVVRSIAPNELEIEIPVNATADGRFWRELSFFRGVFETDGTANGTWNCAPFDIDSGGYVDTEYTASGTWTLVPAF